MSETRAFIVRPFGVKEGIDFERVERELIAPALERCGIEGRTTGEITRQGNIREDMFRLLVISDVVIADVSIHNANVFYELGIRHGLRERHTLLVRAVASKDRYPFDLQTDRYFAYEAANPAAAIDEFVAALRATLASPAKDSPVFQLLPRLRPHDRQALMVVPWDFQEEVARARQARRAGDLRLLAEEASSFEWVSGGLRLVGEAQFQISAFAGARETFESLRRIDPGDFQANYRLGTIFQRLAGLAVDVEAKLDCVTGSEQAIRRVLERTRAPGDRDESAAERAERRTYRSEAHSLLGSNAKTRWLEEWLPAPPERRGMLALRSAHLGESIQHYLDGFAEDLNGFYAGINALAMLKIQVALARKLPEIWFEGFDDERKAAVDLAERERRADRIAATLGLALGTEMPVAQEGVERDTWRDISRADLLFLTLDKPKQVGNAYRKALADAKPFAIETARRGILPFHDLGLLPANVDAALSEIQRVASERHAPPARVVLFTGHMLDAPGLPPEMARFPPTPEAEEKARRMIEEALQSEMKEEGSVSLGIAGGACGGDILFHEACASLGIPTKLFLALPEDKFQVESVNRGGPKWVERYRRLVQRVPPRILAESRELPRWLAGKKGYGVWQRDNLWMMFNALAEGARHLTLIALYNRARDPRGPGGTAHLVDVATRRGFKAVELDAGELLKS
jgi:hypothetical protein